MALMYYLLAKAIRESQKSRSSSSKSKKPEKRDKNYSSYSSSSREKTFNEICENSRFVDWAFSMLKDHPTIKKFMDGVETAKEEALKEIDEKLVSLTDKSVQFADEYKQAVNAVRNAGFVVYEPQNKNYFYVRNENGSVKYYHVPEASHIDGVYLPDIAKGNDENPFKTRLERHEQNNPNMVDNYNQAKLAHDKLAKRKLILKLSDKKRAELETLKTKLSKTEKVLETEKSYQESNEKYIAHKDIILKLIEADKNMSESSKEISDLRNESLLINGYNSWGLDKKKYKEYIGKFMEQSMSKLSETEISDFYAQLEAVATKIAEIDDRELEETGAIKIVPSKIFFPLIYSGKAGFKGNENILVELAQGDALSIDSENYPYVTSRNCTPAQAICDIHASDYSKQIKKYCVFRPYPIRINNVGKAGYAYTGDFAGAKEIDWEEVAKRSGLDPEQLKAREQTTVTKMLRRVSEFSVRQFEQMLLDTKPDECFLNFAEYINGSIEGLNSDDVKRIQSAFENASELDDGELLDVAEKNFALEQTLGYVNQMEKYFNNLLGGKYLKITKIGTGAKEKEILSRNEISWVSDSSKAINAVNPLDYADKSNTINFGVFE